MNSNSPALFGREWNGSTINQRVSDGFVSATAMCQANNKRWENYFRNERTREYIAALAENLSSAAEARNRATGIDDLIQVRKGGQPELQGTWVHPRLAVDLARWISPAFAVAMDQWVLQWLQSQQQQPADYESAWAEPDYCDDSIWSNYRQPPQQRFDNGSRALQLAFVLLALVERVDAGQADQRTVHLIAHGAAVLFAHFRITAQSLAVNTGDEFVHRLSVEIINAVQHGPRYHRRVELPEVPHHRNRRPRSTV